MDYLLFTPVVWFTACFISLCYLTLFRTRKSATYDYSLSKIFSLYLIVHVMSNFMILMAYLFPKYHAVLKLLGGLVVALAAPVYVVLSTALIFRGQFLAFKNSIFVSLVSYVPFVFVYISVSVSTRDIFLFIYYFISATYAYIGTWIVFRRYAWKAKNSELQAYLLLFAGTFGIVNFLLPAVAFLLKKNIEEVSFIARDLDSIFYLPIAVSSMIWLDKKGGYRISHAEGATTYAEGGKRACTSSVLLHQKISLEKIPTESGSKKIYNMEEI